MLKMIEDGQQNVKFSVYPSMLNMYPKIVGNLSQVWVTTQVQIRRFFQPKSIAIFLISWQKHMSWVLIRSASERRF